jgi:hypothetical protein
MSLIVAKSSVFFMGRSFTEMDMRVESTSYQTGMARQFMADA